MEHTQSIIYLVFLIFAGAAVLSTAALFTRQSLLVAYIILGALLGPWGLQFVKDSLLIKQIGDIGILFLLFLLGLHLQPQNLLHSLKKMSRIVLESSLVFLIVGFLISYYFHFTIIESLIIGLCMMFSSTIIGLKLLPTTILHHQHMGELMISVLLLQDLIAIAALLVIQSIGDSAVSVHALTMVILGFPLLLLVAYVFERFVLNKLLKRFDQFHEYIFILSIAWCLAMAELGHYMGLTEEIGAFIAGVALASNPISLYIADSLKPLRDFFLIIFFFTIGAGFNFDYFQQVIWPASILAITIVIFKPLIFNWLLKRSGETPKMSFEVGVRLGQVSEFSLLIVFIALKSNLIGIQTSNVVQGATILTFIASCYWVALRYQTPLAPSEKLRRD